MIRIDIRREIDIARATEAAREVAAKLGLSHVTQYMVATGVSELATNIHRYADCGFVSMRIISPGDRCGIEIIAEDNGPGIENLESVMSDNFSTSGNLGVGLPGTQRMMDDFEIQSNTGGTRVLIRKWLEKTWSNLDYYLVKRPLDNDIYCGDIGMIEEFDGKVFLSVIDVLGHGKDADEVAGICGDFLAMNYRKELVGMVKELHGHIRGTRGAVGSFCLLDVEKGSLSYVSVGDTLVRKLNNDMSRICSIPGIIGYQMRNIREETMQLTGGDILLLHTDGVPAHFDPLDDELLRGDARTIASEIIARFGKKHDDALCIVMRYEK